MSESAKAGAPPSIAELERLAERHSQQGDTAATAAVCRDILSRDGSHLPSLRFLADRALVAGDFAAAEAYLRQTLTVSPGDPQVHSRLGQALYRQGRLQEAVAAYEDCWRLNPRQAMLYLTLGCLHLERGDTDKAAQVFSLGESVDPDLLRLWQRPGVSPAVVRMSRQASDALARHHTELHLQAVDSLGDPAATRRIRDAVWPLLDAREIAHDHPLHRPQVFAIRYDSAPAFFDTRRWPWRQRLESRFPELCEEILSGLDVDADGRPYLGDSHRLEGEQWQPLVNKMRWASVHLFSRGIENARVTGKFPRTLAALAELPLATTGENPSEVFISVLAPHTRIPPHYGVSSAILTAHLPLSVPPGCGLKVHTETRTPEPGVLMVFDDTWEHSAWNDSDEPRVVLIFELWHPELSPPERAAVARTLEARNRWLRLRSVT